MKFFDSVETQRNSAIAKRYFCTKLKVGLLYTVSVFRTFLVRTENASTFFYVSYVYANDIRTSIFGVRTKAHLQILRTHRVKSTALPLSASVCISRLDYLSQHQFQWFCQSYGGSELHFDSCWWSWWYYSTPSEGWGRGGTPQRPNSRATPQDLDHRSRIEREEPKIDLRKGSEAGQSRRR